MVDSEPKPNRRPPPPRENKAYEIPRPLYDQGGNWDFLEYKHHMLEKASIDKLPDLHFFDKGDDDLGAYLDPQLLKDELDIMGH